ncbi:MAG: ribosome small subunit-dependent GTPase A [Candidatus Hydrogenedentes bacterium]|nr:ribosome small subunit-dependent GTPase A [Candidatus Hydrogenedentota bacterium]
MPKGKGRQRKRIRKRTWDASDLDTIRRERRRVRGRESGIGAPVEPTRTDLSGCFSDVEPNATVLSPYGVLAFVEFERREILCRVDDALTDGKTSCLAPGDRVLLEFEEDAESEQPGVVRAVKRRSTKLSRPAIGGGREQVFAANIDLLVVVAAVANPPFRSGLVDRYLIAAERGNVAAALCINKIDLLDAEPAETATYREVGLGVVATSCVTGAGLDGLRELLHGKIGVLAGQSGVGKSSLINALDPRHAIATASVSDTTRKGRHTTSTSKLYHLEGDIHIIDTPGVRQLGLWGVSPDELDYYFSELAALAPQCRFRNCTHIHEPDCAVRAAVESGAIAPARYASYCRIRDSLD